MIGLFSGSLSLFGLLRSLSPRRWSFSVDLADRVECLAVVLNRMIVQAVETGGALTGGWPLDEDFGPDDCLRDTGAALY